MKKILTIFTMAYACSAYAQPWTWSEAGEELFFLEPISQVQGLTQVGGRQSKFDKDGMKGWFFSSVYSIDSNPNDLVFTYSLYNAPDESDFIAKDPGENVTAILLTDFDDYRAGNSLSGIKFAAQTYLFPQTLSSIQYINPSDLQTGKNLSSISSSDENIGFKIDHSLNGGVRSWGISEPVYMYVPNAQGFEMATGTVVGTTSQTTFNYLTPVPEPGLMIAAGLGALAVLRSRKAPKG